MKDTLLKNLHLLFIFYGLYIGYFYYEEQELILEQKKSEVAPAQNQLEKSKRKLKQVKKFEQNLEASKAKVKEIAEQLNRIQRQIPTDLNDVAVQRDMEGLAEDLKIAELYSSPDVETLNEFYFTRQYKVEAKGTYLQFLIFYENLEKLERVLNVREIVFEQASEGRSRFKVLKMNAIIESYRYNTNYKNEIKLENKDGKDV